MIKRIIGLFLFAFILAGCLRHQKAKELHVVMGLTEQEWRVMREDIFPRFEKSYNCKIKAYQVEAADWVRKLEAMVSAGKSSVDVFSQDNMRLYPLVAKGLVEDLSEYKDDISSSIPASIREVGVFGDKTYFLPYRPNVQITYYNEKKFKQYNLELPRTWEELLEVAKAFKAAEGTGRVGFKLWGGSPTATQVYEMIISAGGNPFVFNDEGCLKTFEFLQQLYPYLSPDSRKAKWDSTNTYLANGSFYIAQNWPFATEIIVRQYGKKEIKAYKGWRGPEREAHTIGGEVLGIPKGAPNKKLALQFIFFLESKPIQEILIEKLGWPSVRQDVYLSLAQWQEPYFKAVKAALAEGVFRPNVLYWGEFEKLCNEAVVRIVINKEEPKAVLDECHQKMQKVIAAYAAH